MDPVTHMLIGAAVAQLPPQSTQAQSTPCLSWQKRALIGAFAAIAPDIDYILFWWDPLKFIAYWHRAESHSLLLAPLWAWMLSILWRRWCDGHQHRSLLFWICLAGILSHAIIDSVTTFGTQWFAPLSDYRVHWDLLFVVDGYFTLSTLIALVLVIIWRNHAYRVLSLALPLGYLTLILIFKLNISHQILAPASQGTEKAPELILLPQPFSPLYWQVITPTDQGFNQAYLRLANDVVAAKVSELSGLESYQQSYRLPRQLSWHRYSVRPEHSDWRLDANQVWQHNKFRAFRHFAQYPVFYDYQKSSNNICVWFSDLRYHWPNIIPSFRIGMCRTDKQPWQLYRMKYFSLEHIELLN